MSVNLDLEEKDLTQVTRILRKNTEDKEAFFAFHQYGGDPSESDIHANKEGLIRYAADLLEASISVTPDNRMLELSQEWLYDNGHFYFNNIRLIDKSQYESEQVEYKITWKDKASEYGCFAMILFLILCTIIGLYIIVDYAINLAF
ncbi:hypothetical protein BST97_11610 [Nonlabens spongiae]|uniref:Uncharacterized protein n=1 Tax=Nonlabens spongiae TaxID=331648 RepID=A0A1W6MLV8_9FLAO|nr:hypothetical protein [Nonlabens spongiae]ARN78580.1 hypothetical protein BST97_11610 [Nonlabens spongiae]